MTPTNGGDPTLSISTTTQATAFGDYVEVADGVELFCRHAGADNDGPPLLLLHGNRDNHSHWAEVAELLAPSQHTVAIDFRGHGLSSKVDCALSPELLADDILAVCNHYGFERVVLAGHSLGSVVSMTFAHRGPQRVERLVLLGAAASFTLNFTRPPLPRDETEFAELIRDANRRAAPLFFHPAYPDVQRRVTACWSTIPLVVHRNLVALEHPDLRPIVPELELPVLVIAGQHDRCTTPEQALWIHKHLPDSQLLIVPESAHFMYMEQPALVAERIATFLR
jgi:pimeloyl-ACP methyl ester carboxylesterase